MEAKGRGDPKAAPLAEGEGFEPSRRFGAAVHSFPERLPD